jgi:hypothetical protein
MIEFIMKKMKLLEQRDKLVRVKSWRPWFGPHGLEWPTMLVDAYGYRRVTTSPVLDRTWIRILLRLNVNGSR